MTNHRQPLLGLTTFAVLLSCFLLAPAHAKAEKPEMSGAILFRDKGCAYCHGVTATGTPKGPSLAAVRKNLKTPQIVDQIQNGGQKMPPFGEALSHDQVLQLVAFLRAKHRPTPPPATQIQPAASALSNPVQ